MYEYLAGAIASKTPTGVVIDVGGVGFLLDVSLRTSDRIPAVGNEARLLVHYRLQEDRARLFGFIDEAERVLFRSLISIAGIGPAHALQLLSGAEPEAIWATIRDGEWKVLARTKGIGPKIAQRVCTELGDQAGRQALPSATSSPASTTPPAISEEAVSALLVLGYTEPQAAKAVETAGQKLGEGAALDELVRAALAKA